MSDSEGYENNGHGDESSDQLDADCQSPENNLGNESDVDNNLNDDHHQASPAGSYESRVSEPSEGSCSSPARVNPDDAAVSDAEISEQSDDNNVQNEDDEGQNVQNGENDDDDDGVDRNISDDGDVDGVDRNISDDGDVDGVDRNISDDGDVDGVDRNISDDGDVDGVDRNISDDDDVDGVDRNISDDDDDNINNSNEQRQGVASGDEDEEDNNDDEGGDNDKREDASDDDNDSHERNRTTAEESRREDDDVGNISDSEGEKDDSPHKEVDFGDSDDDDDDVNFSKRREDISAMSDEEIGKGNSDADENVTKLFGNASDISSSSEDGDNEDDAKRADDSKNESLQEQRDSQSSPQRWRNGVPMDYDDDDGYRRADDEEEEEEEIQELRIDAVFPKINTNLGDSLYFVKLPNFLSVDPKAFDELQYEDEVDEEELMDEEGRTRLKLKVENTLRWRYAKDANGNMKYDELGNLMKESNARTVRWSDGSLSLHLGNEVFDVHPMDMRADHTHLFVRQGLGLQGQAVFTSKLSFRPHSTDSFTHRKMTLSLADRSSKAQKVKVLPIVGKNPESQRSELIKKEDEKLKAVMRRENKQKRMKEKSYQRGISTHYMEAGEDDDDDENTVSLSAIKRRCKGLKPIYSSDDDSDDARKKKKAAKRLAESDSETEGPKNPTKKYIIQDSEED